MNFYISISGMNAAQKMMTAASNNLANATNTSYARQRVETVTSSVTQGSSGIGAQLGSGVVVDQVARITDALLIQQSRTETGNAGYYSAVNDVLSLVESDFNETGDNTISQLLNDFFNAFEEVSKYPEQRSYRMSAIYAGVQLAERLSGLSSQIDGIRNQTDTNINTQLTDVNLLLDSIANVNSRLVSYGNQDVNALLDERDKYLDELSKYMDIEIVNKSNPASMEIVVGNTKLVSGTDYYKVEGNYIAENDSWVMTAAGVELFPKSGSVAGLMDARNDYLREYEVKLDKLATTLLNEVNAIHQGGYGLDGDTGVPFFIGTDIRSIAINPELLENPNLLAVSGLDGVIGDSSISKAIASLKIADLFEGVDPLNYYQSIVIGLGAQIKNVNQNYQIHNDVQSAMELQRQSVQGVNSDEELADIMMFQKYYQTNAKTLSTMQKMLDDLMQII